MFNGSLKSRNDPQIGADGKHEGLTGMDKKRQLHHEVHEENEENTCSQRINAVTPHTFADYWFSLL